MAAGEQSSALPPLVLDSVLARLGLTQATLIGRRLCRSIRARHPLGEGWIVRLCDPLPLWSVQLAVETLLERATFAAERRKVYHDVFVSVAASGELDNLRALMHVPWFSASPDVLDACAAEACRRAARRGHLPVLEWLRTQNFLPSNVSDIMWMTVFGQAAEGGHLHVIRWLLEKGYTRSDACDWAARGGHVHVIEVSLSLLARYAPFINHQKAHLLPYHRTQWLLENGFSWGADTYGYAADEGHLHVLQWGRMRGYPWQSETFWGAASAAVSNGHTDVLEWALANGCPLDDDFCR